MSTANEKTTASIPAVKDWETFKVGEFEFIKFPSANGQTPVVMKDIAFISQFGNNNDFRKSNVLKKLESDILPRIIEAVGLDNLCTVKTDLTTLCGLNPYGEMESLISLPTLDFYRANAAVFDKYKVNKWWWLATPESAPPRDCDLYTLCVSPSGRFSLDFCNDEDGVRPFLIFKSTIFKSSEK